MINHISLINLLYKCLIPLWTMGLVMKMHSYYFYPQSPEVEPWIFRGTFSSPPSSPLLFFLPTVPRGGVMDLQRDFFSTPPDFGGGGATVL